MPKKRQTIAQVGLLTELTSTYWLASVLFLFFSASLHIELKGPAFRPFSRALFFHPGLQQSGFIHHRKPATTPSFGSALQATPCCDSHNVFPKGTKTRRLRGRHKGKSEYLAGGVVANGAEGSGTLCDIARRRLAKQRFSRQSGEYIEIEFFPNSGEFRQGRWHIFFFC